MQRCLFLSWMKSLSVPFAYFFYIFWIVSSIRDSFPFFSSFLHRWFDVPGIFLQWDLKKRTLLTDYPTALKKKCLVQVSNEAQNHLLLCSYRNSDRFCEQLHRPCRCIATLQANGSNLKRQNCHLRLPSVRKICRMFPNEIRPQQQSERPCLCSWKHLLDREYYSCLKRKFLEWLKS